MDAFETVRYELDDHLARITLTRPDKRNAMNAVMFRELGDAVDMAGSSSDVWAVLLAGEGPSFCAGIDLALLGELAGIGGLEGEHFLSFVRMAQRPFLLLARIQKPTIAAVQGHALGAGFQLALACDLRVAATDARFAILEARYGLIPDLGGAHHLARIAGAGVAKELVWSARTVEAEEALALRVVNRVVDAETVVKEAESLAREIVAHSPVAISLSKDLIDRAHETPLEVELDREAAAQANAIRSEDHLEAVAAFLERRQPDFKGR